MKKFKLTNDGVSLACYEWSVEKPTKQMIIVHGLAEHAKRYDSFATYLNKQNINVFSMDLRGHGDSLDNGLGVFSSKNGWLNVTKDISKLYAHIHAKHPNLDIILFGHSMGSIFGRCILQQNIDKYSKSILSGVTINKPGLRDVAPFIASLYPKTKPAKALDKLTFGAYSDAFKPNRTSFDWLSRDEKQVDKYIKDDKCGFVASGSMFTDVSKVLLYTLKKKNIGSMAKDTPMFIISGEKDPCGSFGYDALYLQKAYKSAGLNVECKVYKNARHELLNETNKKEVYDDILAFISK